MLHVCVDDARMARLIEALGFFDPSLEVVALPAWDCLPYDRVSPHRDIVGAAHRCHWTAGDGGGAPRAGGHDRGRAAAAPAAAESFDRRAARPWPRGRSWRRRSWSQFLAANGYARSGTVAEAGEFAVRGGIVDLFPPGAAAPLRVDFFGDEIEAIREFDPLTQRSAGRFSRFVVRPVSELTLDTDIDRSASAPAIASASAPSTDDPLYEAVSAGRLYPGHGALAAAVPAAHGDAAGLSARGGPQPRPSGRRGDPGPLRHHRRFLSGARRSSCAASKSEGAAVYRPLPPDALYLGRTELEKRLADRAVVAFSPFADTGSEIDAGGRRGQRFRRSPGPARGQSL